MSTYIVLVLCHNEIHYCEPFDSLEDTEAQAVSLANKWYREDGIKSFGLNKITSKEEMNNYYGSDAYFDSADSAHIVIETLI